MAMVPQGQSLHALQQAIDGVGVGVDHLKVLDVGLGVNWVGHSGPPLQLSPLGEGQGLLSQAQGIQDNSPECMVRCWAGSPVAAAPNGGGSPRAVEGWDQLSHTHTTGASSPGWKGCSLPLRQRSGFSLIVFLF